MADSKRVASKRSAIRTLIKVLRPWRVITFILFTAGAVVAFVFIKGTAERVAIATGYASATLTLLTINLPSPSEAHDRRVNGDEQVRNGRHASPYQATPRLDSALGWWDQQPRRVRLAIQAATTILFVSAMSVASYEAVQVPSTPVEFIPARTQIAEGVPVVLDARGSATGSAVISVRIQLIPIGKDGFCTTPASISLTPILDRQERAEATKTVRNNVLVNIAIDGQFQTLQLSVLVRTTPNCLMTLSVQEAYYNE